MSLNHKINQFVFLTLFFLVVGDFLNNVSAHPVDDNQIPDKVQVIILAENMPAETNTGNVTMGGLNGPAETRGIASIDPMGIIDLGGEFPAMQGRQLRARMFTIEPGGVVGIHTHIQRPGYAFIISGSIIEHRNDGPEPFVRSAGDIAMEKEGVTHWWENTFAEPVKALVVDIFTPEQ
jgi:quercetin dioxygenase-like cupin family protein